MDYLEDELSDVISKAQRGLGLATSTIAERTRLDPAAVRSLRSGSPLPPDALEEVAAVLGLRAEGLRRLASDTYAPAAHPPAGLHPIDMPADMHGDERMRVNAFLVFPPGSADALLFDTGTDAAAIDAALRKAGRELRAIFITHAHWDHYHALPEVRLRWPGAAVHGPASKRLEPQTPLAGGEKLDFGPVQIEVRSTPGHAPRSLSYVVEGLARSVAIVGDALMAGSVGGILPEAYAEGLAAIRTELLSLPADTIVASGHGMLTTIGYERAHNPFFPEGGI